MGSSKPFLLLLLLVSVLQQLIHGHGCDLYEGKWVYDESAAAPYDTSKDCPFIIKQFDCLTNGRSDHKYLKYRWQPTACNLTRFNGEDFLNRMKGKKIMFVGDSLSLNQWQSLTCMLHKAVPNAPFTDTRAGLVSTFTFTSFNTKIMFFRSPFIVDLVKENEGRVMKLNSIVGGKLWAQNDVLIFDSWHWWLHSGRKQPWDWIENGKQKSKDMDRLKAYEIAMKTWANWVEHNVDPAKTKVFFQGVSPDHDNGADWGKPDAQKCTQETEPLLGPVYPAGKQKAEVVVENVISKMKSKAVHLLNITPLSQLRKDAHPAFHGTGGHKFADCTHWCLPGLPDTWNQLLYASLI